MIKNLKLKSGEWSLEKVPCKIVKHRVVKTDPTYKFVIHADVYVRSNVAINKDISTNTYYYDLLNILAPSQSVVTGTEWLELLSSQYNLDLQLGNNYYSYVFPTTGFETEQDRDLFDEVYYNLSDSNTSNGLNTYVDFTLQISQGFIKNKLGLDTNKIQPEFLNNLSFSLLKTITNKETPFSDFKILESYKNNLNLSSEDMYLIESLLKINSVLYPKNQTTETSFFWDLFNKFIVLEDFFSKQNLFGFYFNKTQITGINNKDFGLSTDKNNLPINVNINNGIYSTASQTIIVNL